jgi:hypothetical protein
VALLSKDVILHMLYWGQSTAHRLAYFEPEAYADLKESLAALGLAAEAPPWIDEPADAGYAAQRAARLAALERDEDDGGADGE